MPTRKKNKQIKLYGIYGVHTPESCPVTNTEVAARLVEWFENTDVDSILGKYKIDRILGQFHSPLEHSLLWGMEAEDPHLIQKVCFDSPLASFHTMKIVPMTTFAQVIQSAKKNHSL